MGYSIRNLFSFSALQKEIHKLAKEKGWWNGNSRNVGESLALMISELTEALEEYRNGRGLTEIYTDDNGKPMGYPIELADTVIRILDHCGGEGIDLEKAIRLKHSYNKSRPYRHGGKKI